MSPRLAVAARLAAGYVGLAGAIACSAPAHEGPVPASPADRGTGSGTGPVGGSGARRVDREAPHEPLAIPVAQLDRVLQRGPGWLLRDVPLEPVLDARRQLVGFRIISLWNGDLRVARGGVKPGDILRSINGVRIVTPDDLVAAFTKMATAPALELDLGRAGEALHVRIPILRSAVDP